MKDVKLKEYATKIKNRLTGQNTKPQKEEKDDLSEKIAERTQELVAEDRQEAVRAAVVEAPEPEEAGITEAFERLKPAFEQIGKAIAESFKGLNWSGLLSHEEMISNNRRKMKGMPMIRAKALEKARKNKSRKPKK